MCANRKNVLIDCLLAVVYFHHFEFPAKYIVSKLTGSTDAGSYPTTLASEAEAAVEAVEAVDEADEDDVDDEDESGGGRGGPEEP